MWGSEGKGTISIVIANAAAVSFFSSIFSGSSTSYFASRFRIEKILLYISGLFLSDFWSLSCSVLPQFRAGILSI
jgi:hypothetical protein